VFSRASRFSKPISQAIPSGRPGEGSKDNFTIGIRAWGRGLTWNFVSTIQIQVCKVSGMM
jgi:hypothetical protein